MEVDCSICHKVIDHTEAWVDDEKEELFFACAQCEEDRVKHLKTCSAERMLHLMRLCHPMEHGEPYGRWEVMEEVQRRAFGIFDGLKWPRNPEAVYKNRYTANEQTLVEMFGEDNVWHSHQEQQEKRIAFEEWLIDYSWSIIEHWTPIEIWTEVDLLDSYKRRPTLEKWGFK